MTDRDQRFAEEVQPTEEEKPHNNPLFTRVHDKFAKLNLFTAFCELPKNVTFQTQEPGEKVLAFLRKSKWINFPWIVISVILTLIPFVLFFLRENFLIFIPPLNVLFVSVAFYYLLIAIYVFVNFVTWYYNAALITDKRIVDIDFHQVVFKDIAETKLALVQDVSYQQVGVLPNILGYGYVLIQTAGTLENFEFYNLPHPDRVEEIVEDLIGGRRSYEP